MRSFAILTAITVLLSSCEEPINWEREPGSEMPLVIEAMLTNRSDLNYVKLSMATIEPGAPSPVIDNALVYISDGTTLWTLDHQSGTAGTYLPSAPMVGAAFKPYRLIVNLNGREYTADAYMVPVSPLKDFLFYEADWNPGKYIIVPEEGGNPSFVKYEINYYTEDLPPVFKKGLFYSFTLSTVDVNQFFKPRAERLLFPAGSVIIRTKYSMSPDHEKFIRSMLSETEWKGGWFDLYPGNPFTNISGGAYGFFAACSVARDTVYFQ